MTAPKHPRTTPARRTPGMARALEIVRQAMNDNIRPHIAAIAHGCGVNAAGLYKTLTHEQITLPPGKMSAYDTMQWQIHYPDFPLPSRDDEDEPSSPPAAHAASRHTRTTPYNPAARPSNRELEDACARWGIDGAAEEYEVSEAQICAWLREHGERQEGAACGRGAADYSSLLDVDQIARASAMRRKGKPWHVIGETFGLSARVIQRIIQTHDKRK